MAIHETLSLIVQTIIALFVGGSLIYAGKQVSLIRLTHNDNHEWHRRLATQNALRDLNNSLATDELQEKFNFLNRKQPISISEIIESLEKNPNLQVQINRLLNEYETFSRGVFLGVYDEKLLKNARKGSMERTFNAFKEYINYRRNEGAKSFYIEYEKLLDKWHTEYKKEGHRDHTGKI